MMRRLNISMKLIQFFENEIITEMPIGDITHLGNWEKNSSFRTQDRKLLTNPKAITKIKSMWKGPEGIQFNIMLLNHAEGTGQFGNGEAGIVTDEWLKKNMPRSYDDIKNAMRENEVNIVYINNSGSPRNPMTGWVMAHRLAHALNARQSSFYFKEAEKVFDRYTQFFADQYGMGNNKLRHDIDKNRLALLRAICTFKSARENNIARPYEAFYELFAQYIITGKIKFNPLPDNLKWGTTYYRYQHSSNDNGALDDFAFGLTEYFETAIHYAVGKILIM